MAGQHRRQPTNVLRLLNDAQARQTERQVAAEHLGWLRRLLASDRAARAARRGGGGTRKQSRD